MRVCTCAIASHSQPLPAAVHKHFPLMFAFFCFVAGGLATYLHADYVKDFLPSTVSVKAIADAG